MPVAEEPGLVKDLIRFTVFRLKRLRAEAATREGQPPSYLGAASMRSKKLLAYVSTAALFVSATRIIVLLLESLAAVQDERKNDLELLEICRQGTARGSTKMRSACLAAESERASPLLLKAVVRAVYTSWSEFAAVVSAPYGLLTMVGFVFASLVLPTAQWAKLLAKPILDDDDVESHRHVIVLAGGPDAHASAGGIRRRISGFLTPPDRNGFVELPPSDW
jgi:hypothetical protein